MSKRILIWMIVCFGGSVGVVIGLITTADYLKDQPGSFLRTFPPHPVLEGDTVNVFYESYYIAGGTDHRVYLGNYTAPLHVLEVNLDHLADTNHITLQVDGIYDQKVWSPRVVVDSPYFYLSDGAVPMLFRGEVASWKAERILRDTIYFRKLVPIHPTSFAIQSLHGGVPENILGKWTVESDEPLLVSGILEKQIDGVFCTDGMLNVDAAENRIAYLYYYRNEYIVMDTMLHILFRSHTLDTTSRAAISVKRLADRSVTLSSPPRFVNHHSSISDGFLFVHSAVRARNESTLAFSKAAVIDVYEIATGDYRFSFYLYHYWGNKRLTDFRVFGHRVVVLYGNVLRVFEIVPSYFERRHVGALKE
jgi:hypothetical protein